MRVVVSHAVKCGSCGHIVEGETSVEVCDWCNKKIEWSIIHGFPFTIDFMHNFNKEECKCKDNIPRWNFCSPEHGRKWIRESAVEEANKHTSGFYNFHINPEDLAKLVGE